MVSWSQSFRVYLQPNMLAMLFLGFSAGLPLYLVFFTLSYWLSKEGIELSTIGKVSWVTLFYGLKFTWAPLVDRLPIPIVTSSLGQRRSWMLVAQIGVIVGLFLLGSTNPQENFTLVVLFAILIAFSSATQDIAIDAWRIESAPDNQQGAMAGTYQLGYRLGLLLAGGGAFTLANFYGWNFSYMAMGLAMIIGVITTLVISEPNRQIGEKTWKQEKAVKNFLSNSSNMPANLRKIIAWFIGAVICPFTEFFMRSGLFGLTILLFIASFKLSEIAMGVMAGPFYEAAGYTELQVGLVSKTFGIFVTIVGALLGGVLVMRYSITKVLVLAGVLIVTTNMVFAWLATQDPETMLLALVITADNLSGGIAGTAFIAYLSSLTNRLYTATQYALFTSVMVLPAKFLGGFSGQIAESIGWVNFFLYAGSLGIPAIFLALYVGTRQNKNNLKIGHAN